MSPLVLVAYAARKGASEEVAREIAAGLSAFGAATDLRAAADVERLDGYDGVVLGSAFHAAGLHPDASAFLRRHRARLAELPVAVFALGPREPAEGGTAEARRLLESALAGALEPAPFATAAFGGAFDAERHHFPFNHRPAVDARDWNAIRAWAVGLARRFDQARAA